MALVYNVYLVLSTEYIINYTMILLQSREKIIIVININYFYLLVNSNRWKM